MHPRDLMVTQQQRYERFAHDAEQWRLAKLARMAKPRPRDRVRAAWAWVRRLVSRRQRAPKQASRPVELNLRPASE